jgi:excisionase family DNA binding protein
MTNFENSPPSATSARARRRQRREPLQFYTVAEVAESHSAGATAQKPSAPTIVLLTPKEAAKLLKISRSWLAKARMRGDGPPYIKFGKSIRYPEAALLEWLKVPHHH